MIVELQKGGLRDLVQVIIGGAPITPQYANDSGADIFAAAAAGADDCARQAVAVST